MIYQSNIDHRVIEANQVTNGHRETLVDYNGDRVTAESGDYTIVYPWVEVVDPDSFEREYEERDA